MKISVPGLDALGEAAKGFIQKVITPPLEEVGLLLSDQVKIWRFKNQVKAVTKAEEYLKSKNIKTKKVNLKVMAPLLEGVAMEEEEVLQEKWAALLANTVDENSLISNSTLYSSILAQLTKADAQIFDRIYDARINPSDEKGIITSHTFTAENEEISVDNLIRLRLIKEITTLRYRVTYYVPTSIGKSFLSACTFKP